MFVKILNNLNIRISNKKKKEKEINYFIYKNNILKVCLNFKSLNYMNFSRFRYESKIPIKSSLESYGMYNFEPL